MLAYSTSVKERPTTYFFLEHKEIVPKLRVNKYPKVELLSSISLSYSTSKKP
jgi:hypothetical protein